MAARQHDARHARRRRRQHRGARRPRRPAAAGGGEEVLAREEVAGDEDHGVAAEDVVAAEGVAAVDGEAEAERHVEHAARHLGRLGRQRPVGRHARRAVVARVGDGQLRGGHRQRAHRVQRAQHHAQPPQDHPPAITNYQYNCSINIKRRANKG